jgi:hypothetical protein
MITLVLYMGATLAYLMALALSERSKRISQGLFVSSGLGYIVAGLLVWKLELAGLLLGVSIVWHGVNSFVGAQRYYDKEHLQIRLLRSWTLLVLLNAGFYVLHVLSVEQQIATWRDVSLLGIAAVMLGTTLYNLRQARVMRSDQSHPISDPPSVSLLIPARNEDHALTEALHVALTLDYPRLEIIVLDDCSHDRTPEIIREFAQYGVRFIQTTELPEGWLGKNYAQTRLSEEASGEILFFADVDILLSPHSVSQIISTMQTLGKDMISVAPVRRGSDLWPQLCMPLAYWFQIALPTAQLGIPTVSSGCYAIRKDAYRKLGGHRSSPMHVMPEQLFARLLGRRKSYSFVVGDERLGVTIRKKLSSQEMTSLRQNYPLLGAAPGVVLTVILLGGYVIMQPVYATLAHFSLVGIISWVLMGTSLFLVARRIQPHVAWLAYIQLPLLFVHEAGLLVVSMVRYELASVTWKERSICYPKLQVIPQLPKLK